jgi:RNA polymerase sigma-70 factor (ECF subfamily)
VTTGPADLDGLALAARGGDRLALGSWIRHSQTDVWRLCAALHGQERAGPLTEATFVRAYRSLTVYRQGADSRLWVLAIAARLCTAEARRRRLARRIAGPEQTHGQRPLAFRDQLAMTLTGPLHLRYGEAALVLGCSEAQIRQRVAQARDQLIQRAGADGPARLGMSGEPS